MVPRTVWFRSWFAWAGSAAALYAGLLATGCLNVERPPVASAMKHPVLEDIPLPNHFELVDDQSMARASGRMRIARVKFLGPTERTKVTRFFEEHMPQAGFELRHSGFDRGVYEMRFESSNEECTLRVVPERRNKTAVYVDLGPLALEAASRQPPAAEAAVPPPSAADAGMP
jgi:hypothetical protein